MGFKTDYKVDSEDIQKLSGPDSIAAFFSNLGYNTNNRVEQNPEHLGISNKKLLDNINHFERISLNGSLNVYLVELESVTVANTNRLARSFKESSGMFILVLTSDYNKIDVVFLERVTPISTKKTKTTGKPRFNLRPRSLTINKDDLDLVTKRVLRRFTFTCEDEYAQYDKIKSAYTILDWSEDFFNNKALFSDYYLTDRLKDMDVWKEKAEDIHRKFRNDIRPYSKIWGNKNESEFFSEFIEPSLELLGFDYERNERESEEDVEPHYYLYSEESKDKISAVLTYRWNRFLDGKESNTSVKRPEENPSQAVVSLLENEDLEWVIVTNGKVWRLYSSSAHSRATNYYEIDLEETISLEDPNEGFISEAFRYFWLFFREEAFTQQEFTVEGGEKKEMRFLDYIQLESQRYSKELEDRLKDKVYEEIVPVLAEGFIKNIGTKEELLAMDQNEREKICKNVFEGTLTVLYRTLFLLYAESRDLLPVKETRGYYEKSIESLKKEIAKKAGKNADNAEHNLKQHYTKSDYDLYDRLLKLSKIIDKGKPSLNVPTYNGGLFDTDPEEPIESREDEISKFLLENKIPDYHLAYGLDKLTRDEDPKKLELVPIDYKSLGVRQLGSIYEGLLEFNVKIAKEKLAVIKGDKTEEYMPYDEAVDNNETIVKDGRGRDAEEKVLTRGTVYIENDKGERKASGSYYTPDYIVKYIVENTVGPVLEEKFDKLRPKLREISGKEIDEEKANELSDELFDIHVLDPAMGSGHFLVETVDFITDNMLDFLNGFPDNPIQMQLQKIRDTIMDEMNKQGISIDQNKLIDVSLMKRYVLKRCVYGVDVNPMAVELSKVSLWLDCFTLGAPLSFLDHHLKCGNSLIGSSYKDAVENILGKKGTQVQSTFKGSGIWSGGLKKIRSAMEDMIHVGELSDITTDMVEESRKSYEEAIEELEPYKRMLDVYTSRWFSNEPENKVDEALEFLRSKKIKEWLKNTGNNKILKNDQKEIVKSAIRDYENHNFFHWELEFPEIFYGESGFDTVSGFDAVVGNPPWGESVILNIKDYLKKNYGVSKQNLNAFDVFTRRCLLISENMFGFLVPRNSSRSNDYKNLRKFILYNYKLENLKDWKKFPGITYEAMSVITSNTNYSGNNKITINDEKFLTQNELLDNNEYIFNIYSNLKQYNIKEKMKSSEVGWIDLVEIKRGEEISQAAKVMQCPNCSYWRTHSKKDEVICNNCGEKFDKKKWKIDTLLTDKADGERIVAGPDIEEFILDTGRYIDFNKRGIKTKKNLDIYEPDKILLKKIEQEPVSTYDKEGVMYTQNVYGLEKKDSCEFDKLLLTAFLNSKYLKFFYDHEFNLGANWTTAISQKNIRQGFPIPNVLKSEEEKISELADQTVANGIDFRNEKDRFIEQLCLEWNVNIENLSLKTHLKEYWEYDFDEMLRIVKKNRSLIQNNTRSNQFKKNLKEKWQESMEVLNPLMEEIQDLENEIDALVFKLYELDEEEIEIVLDSLETEEEIKEDILEKFRDLPEEN